MGPMLSICSTLFENWNSLKILEYQGKAITPAQEIPGQPQLSTAHMLVQCIPFRQPEARLPFRFPNLLMFQNQKKQPGNKSGQYTNLE